MTVERATSDVFSAPGSMEFLAMFDATFRGAGAELLKIVGTNDQARSAGPPVSTSAVAPELALTEDDISAPGSAVPLPTDADTSEVTGWKIGNNTGTIRFPVWLTGSGLACCASFVTSAGPATMRIETGPIGV
jgi:hypothetical protein